MSSRAQSATGKALLSRYDNVFLLDGVRTPFIEYNTALGLVSPTDLGIKAARAVFHRASVAPTDVDIVFLLDGVRTPFIEYNTALGLVSPTDLGIKAARAVFHRASVAPTDVDIVIAGNTAQASF